MITGEATPGEIIKRSNPHPNFGSEDQKSETSCDAENTGEHCVLLCLLHSYFLNFFLMWDTNPNSH